MAFTAATGSCSLALTTCVAPTSLASARREGHDVDGNDRRGADDARRHDRAQSHRAGAEGREARAGSHFQRVHDRARPSLYAATERSEQLQRRLFRHLHDVALVGNRERAKGRLAEEMTVHPSAIVAKSAAAVRSPAAEIVGVEVRRNWPDVPVRKAGNDRRT